MTSISSICYQLNVGGNSMATWHCQGLRFYWKGYETCAWFGWKGGIKSIVYVQIMPWKPLKRVCIMWQKHAKPIKTTVFITNYAHSYSADAPNFQRPKPSNETAFCLVNPQFSVAKYFLWHGKPANPEFDWSFFVKICPHSLLNTYLKWIVKIIIWRLKS